MPRCLLPATRSADIYTSYTYLCTYLRTYLCTYLYSYTCSNAVSFLCNVYEPTDFYFTLLSALIA